MGVHWTFCDNHFVVCVSRIIMLYTLNLHSAVSQLCLNKPAGNKIDIFAKKKSFEGNESKLLLYFYLYM